MLISLAGGRSGRRAALRGLTAATTASGMAAVIALVLGPRWRLSPQFSAVAGFVVGSAIEAPLATVPFGLAGLVAAQQVKGGQSSALGSVVGAALGAGVAMASRHSWPVAPTDGADLRPRGKGATGPASPEGGGVALVVNPNAGSALDRDLASQLHQELPEARVITLDEGDELDDALRGVVSDSLALGVAGGDGSVNAAAAVAYEHNLPLVVVPGGTLNHFARDLGLDSVSAAVSAVRQGRVVDVDLARIADRQFLNTAAFGSYPELVDIRESLEGRIGKWPAMVLALIRILRHGEPIDVELDGEQRLIWMIFIGNCRYHPSGFAPSWRQRLDDGQIDIRVVDATFPWGRARLVAAVLTGRLGRCRVYEQRCARELRVSSRQGPLRLTSDGEAFD
ncbi:MAG: diacylglycerol/lipid kinase family protein, partial [Pseudonocardiaceae bacterium]